MAASVTMMIPAVLRYDLRATDSGWQISRLRAYWELPAMIAQFLARGARSLPASMQLSSALLRNQRLGGTAGFLAAVRGPRRRGKRLVQDMLRVRCRKGRRRARQGDRRGTVRGRIRHHADRA